MIIGNNNENEKIMRIIDKLIEEKEREIIELKPKYYLILGYLSTFMSLQSLNVIIIPGVYLFLHFLILESDAETNIEEIMRHIIYLFVSFFFLVLSFDFRYSYKIVDDWFGIRKYKEALYDLSVLQEKKSIIEESEKICETIKNK